jgi:carbonic anhydrase/acetyltransferase-like protein (isoleucine patch superfamily)
MLIEHAGQRPQVDSTAWVAPNAVLSGNVTVGANARVLYGAVLTAERGQRLTVGPECVVMEQAVLRAAGRFPLDLGERVLVGPHAYLTGCRVGPRCFIATGAMVFNGACLREACVVALGGKVHIDTELPAKTFVPIGYIAIGRPGKLYPPHESPAVHAELDRISFARYVFGVEPEGKDRARLMDEMLDRYTRALAAHRDDRIVDGPPERAQPEGATRRRSRVPTSKGS